MTVSNTSKAFYLKSIKVTYTPAGGSTETGPEVPTFKVGGETVSGSVTVEKGTAITIATVTDGANVTVTSDPADAVVITTDTNGVVATISKTCILTAVAELSGEKATSTLDVTVTEPAAPGTFKLLTDLSQLTAGMEVILAYDTHAIGTTATSSKYDKSEITLNADKTQITNTADANIFTIEATGTENVWYFKGSTGYMNSPGSSTSVSFAQNPTLSTNHQIAVSVGKENNTFKLDFKSNDDQSTDRALLWRAGTVNQFANYAYSNASSSTTGEYHCLSIYYRDSAAAEPEFSVAAGATTEVGSDGLTYYTNPFEVTIATVAENATIHYTINGGEEQTGVASASTVTLTVDATQTIKAWAVSSEEDINPSDEVTVTYNLRTATPVISCADPEDAMSKTVTIACATTGATIEYSTDGGESWLSYSNALTFNEMNTSTAIMARATSTLGESEQTQYEVGIYPAIKWKPFELVTDITKLVPGDEMIFVAADYDYAMAPYVSGNNCKANEIVKDAENKTVNIAPGTTNVEVFTVEKTVAGDYKFKGTQVAGYLAAVAGNENRLYCLAEDAIDPAKHATDADVVIDPKTGVATVLFAKEGITRTLMRYSHGATKLFSCYEPSTTGTYNFNIYRRGIETAATPAPVATPQEGLYNAGEVTSVTLACGDFTNPELKIWYTTDGSDPRKGGTLYTGAIAISGSTTVRAYATCIGYFDSAELIANYDIYSADKVYRRVTEAEIGTLAVDDDIIVLASPTGDDTVYAMSRTQNGSGENVYRKAIALGNTVSADGRITISSNEVQVLKLLSGKDYYDSKYDWRLYASGVTAGSEKIGGYLNAQGNVNALQTTVIDSPASTLLSNADLRFRSTVSSEYGNEYGGLTVQFGVADGETDSYPKFMALTKAADDSYRFDVRAAADFTAADPSSWYVSIFKAFDPNLLYAPSFATIDAIVTPDTGIEIISANSATHPDTEIWYSIDGGTTWEKYTAPFYLTEVGTTYTVQARTRNASLEGGDAEGYSGIVSRQYTVTDMEIYELVTDASTLKENDRVIFVNAIKFPGSEESSGWYAPTSFESGRFNATWVAPVDAGEAIPTQLIVPSDAGIQAFRLEYDTSAADPSRPWLIYLVGQDKYLRSAAAKTFEIVDLPATVEERQYLNAGFEIGTVTDYNDYKITGTNVSTSSSMMGEVEYKLTATFNGLDSLQTHIRFNPSNGIRFRGYDVKHDGNGTWPTRLYRTTKRVLPPTVTVYDATVEGDKAYSSQVTTYSNPVRVVIKNNPRTDKGVYMMYSWSESVDHAPVLSEYLAAEPVDAEEIQLLVDGDKVQIKSGEEFVDIAALSTIEGKHVLRALTTDGSAISSSLPRTVNFKCSKPVLSKGEGDMANISRPEAYTIGATLYYAYDDDEFVYDEAHKLSYIDGTTEFASIAFDEHAKVKVIAKKEGYADSDEAVLTLHTYTPQAHAVQLLELTETGKTNYAALLGDGEADFIGEGKCYVTYRTVAGQPFFLLKENADGTIAMAKCSDTAEARRLADYRPTTTTGAKVNVKWTSDYYVFVADEDSMLDAIGGTTLLGNGDATVDDGEIVTNVFVNGSVAPIAGQKATVDMGDATTKRFYGAIVRQNGAIGTITLRSTLEYKIYKGEGAAADNYLEEGFGQITPLIPSVYGCDVAYEYAVDAESLASKYATDFVKLNVESQVKKDGEGKASVSAALLPTAEATPRHLKAVVTFFRPNVSSEILQHNDIYYNIDVTGSMHAIAGSGLYVDLAKQNEVDGTGSVTPDYYQFTIDNVSPAADDYPSINVSKTEFVENYSETDDYDRFVSNFGENISIINAGNDPVFGNGSVSKFFMGKLAPNGVDARGNENTTDKTAWMFKGLNSLVAPTERLHDGINITPSYYLVETYAGSMTDYAAYEYLVNYAGGHAGVNTELKFNYDGTFNTTDETDPLMGTYTATGFTATSGISVALTPVYLFSHQPTVKPNEVKSSEIAPLKSVSLSEAAAVVAVKAPVMRAPQVDTATLGSEPTAPVLGEVRPMRHYGLTDMSASNITDLTASTEYEVVTGNPIVRTLEVGEVTGVEDVSIDNDSAADVEYYNLQGVRIVNPGHGIYIKRRGNKAEKVRL